jgi:chemotaxis protein MotB
MVKEPTVRALKYNTQISTTLDLSVHKSTAVILSLQNNFSFNPQRMVADGRGKFSPVTNNYTADGRTQNRRTRIIILPQADQYFNLHEMETSNYRNHKHKKRLKGAFCV